MIRRVYRDGTVTTDEQPEEPTLVCVACGFEGKTTGGLATHCRVHDEEE